MMNSFCGLRCHDTIFRSLTSCDPVLCRRPANISPGGRGLRTRRKNYNKAISETRHETGYPSIPTPSRSRSLLPTFQTFCCQVQGYSPFISLLDTGDVVIQSTIPRYNCCRTNLSPCMSFLDMIIVIQIYYHASHSETSMCLFSHILNTRLSMAVKITTNK